MSALHSTTLSMFITDLQGGSVKSFAAWIVLGLLIGLIGSKIVNKTGRGFVRDVLLSIVGAIVCGFLANLLGESHTAGLDFYSPAGGDGRRRRVLDRLSRNVSPQT